MASTILADNGVSSGSAGIKTTADSTGALALQTTTAGGTATTAVTIDTSQNVGIGTSSPASRLHTRQDKDGVTSAIVQNRNGSGTPLSEVAFITGGLDFSDNRYAYVRSGGGSSTYLSFGTGAGATPTERMRIDSSGNVGIGNTPVNTLDVLKSSQGFHVNQITNPYYGSGFVLDADSGSANQGWRTAARYVSSGVTALVFETSNSTYGYQTNPNAGATTGWTERVRIDSNGTFTVSGSYSNSYAAVFGNTSTTSGSVSIASSAGTNSNATYIFYGTSVSANRFSAYGNGGLANYSANNINLSDRREKTNFAPAKNYLETICSIPVQTFNYIDQDLENDGGLTLGVVAQDVEAVAPELVKETNWGTEDEPKMRLSIYQTDLQYALMKCIQEQQALINNLTESFATLTARIEALEAK